MDKKAHLKKHVEVLKKSYENIVLVMEDDIETKTDEEGKETITLKDEKIKTYAEGIKKLAETLNYLYEQIGIKEKELSDLESDTVKGERKTKVIVQESTDLSTRIN